MISSEKFSSGLVEISAEGQCLVSINSAPLVCSEVGVWEDWRDDRKEGRQREGAGWGDNAREGGDGERGRDDGEQDVLLEPGCCTVNLQK